MNLTSIHLAVKGFKVAYTLFLKHIKKKQKKNSKPERLKKTRPHFETFITNLHQSWKINYKPPIVINFELVARRKNKLLFKESDY